MGIVLRTTLGLVRVAGMYSPNVSLCEKENDMLRVALLFLVIALIAGALGLYPVAALSSEIAWVLFVIFLVLFVVSLVFGGLRTGPPPL
jgi:uncharacterized membrane protein YtjA (UPF0391 family)